MNLPLFIARRYLFARKSHNVINVISAISAAGMAIGTAALILILSVYNGFDSLIKQNLGDLDPDLMMVHGDGAAKFVPDSLLLARLSSDPRVESVSRTLEDNVFLIYGEHQGLARAKGVEEVYTTHSRLASHIYEGSLQLHRGEIPMAIAGSTLAHKMGIHPRFVDMLEIYYPDRDASISISNPAASARCEKVLPAGLMSISSDTDAELLIVPLSIMESLLGSKKGEASGVEIRLLDNSRSSIRAFKKDYAEQCTLLDSYEQHPTLFRMMKYEKAAVFFILLFVVIIVAFNIFGSLSMLIIEKKEDIATLQAMGASKRLIKRIFLLEGWLISLCGLLVGLAAGIILALLQQHLGIVKMPGNFLVSSYPVVLQLSDVLLTAAGVALIGLVVAFVSSGGRGRQI
ncbi:MAG: ABC transporter permease [Bacteroidales bacterium]|nr:ABC transporter permease [Bacteroidales bacterium]